jgi:3-oxoadipate enol-lactonase/4-carboxymuconolactone decarboxylase
MALPMHHSSAGAFVGYIKRHLGHAGGSTRRSFYVIRFDLRGHGLTTTTPGPYDIAMLARDALAVLDSLGIASAHVAGISIGGLIAQSLAVQAPARVRSLILVDTALAFQPPERRNRAARVRADGIAPLADSIITRWVTPAFLEAPETTGLRTMLLRTPPEGHAACAEAIGAADFTETSRSIRARTLVVVGAEDEATPPCSAEALRDAIPDADLVVLSSAAHIPAVEQPVAVLAAMTRFLAATLDPR